MADFKFTPSDRTFTSPVRKFKENDPYYFEVDNIPLGPLVLFIMLVRGRLKQQPRLKILDLSVFTFLHWAPQSGWFTIKSI